MNSEEVVCIFYCTKNQLTVKKMLVNTMSENVL